LASLFVGLLSHREVEVAAVGVAVALAEQVVVARAVQRGPVALQVQLD
jgi:hypothetical protein